MEEKLYPRRWAILAALFLCLVTLQFSFIIPGGAALSVMMRYGIDGTLFSMVMSVPYFAGIVFGIFLGTLADRVGVSKVMVVCYVIALFGVAWRAMSGNSFIMLFLSSLVMGVATAALNANSAKVIRAWFPGKSANAAFGVYVCGASLGAAIALQVGARLTATDILYSAEGAPMGLADGASGLQTCWWISVILFVISIACWFVLYREHPDGIAVEEPIMQHMGYALKKKSVWGISLFAFLFMGATVIGTSFMVASLQTVYGADATTAANISTVNTAVVCIGCIALPAVVARFKHSRPVFLGYAYRSWCILCRRYVCSIRKRHWSSHCVCNWWYFLCAHDGDGQNAPCAVARCGTEVFGRCRWIPVCASKRGHVPGLVIHRIPDLHHAIPVCRWHFSCALLPSSFRRTAYLLHYFGLRHVFVP